MKKKITLLFVSLIALFLVSCDDINPDPSSTIELKAHSKTPNFLKTTNDFSSLEIYPVLSSEDQLTDSPDFVYGSMADGAGLLKNSDGTFTLINNIEADYSIARVTLDETFKPVKGEYILNAEATARTAQCSGSLITQEEHGFGPLYLSGGEWGGSSKAIFATEINKASSDASVATILTAFGQWSTENAVVIGKDAYSDKTVAFIGDDHSDNTVPSGQLGMYVGVRGDLENGKLYGLKVITEGVEYEMDMKEGQSYEAEFVELNETEIDALDAECKEKGVMGFSRLEDLDWRRGNADAQRELYFCVTGRIKADLEGKGTKYGRIYKVELNDNDPTGTCKITCVLDGDKLSGKAAGFHSPDNIVVTSNYAYIQEDPNGYFDTTEKIHFARLYQYNLNDGSLKIVLECDQNQAASEGYGSADDTWELTGMIDVSDILEIDNTFLLITQNHGWEDDSFTDDNATQSPDATEGSTLFIVKGLER